jgi:hypothetical protein
VGKTVNRLSERLQQHVNDANRGRVNIHRFRWIRGLTKLGLRPEIFELEKVHDGWEEAEQFWIAYFRSLGASLCNATAGGDGLVGFTHSEETRRKQSVSGCAAWTDPATRARRGEAIRKAYSSQEARDRLSTALKLAWTPEKRERHAELCRGIANRQEVRDARSKALTGRVFTQEWRAKISASKTGQRPSQETRQKMREAQQGRRHGEETIKKMRAAAMKREALKKQAASI